METRVILAQRLGRVAFTGYDILIESYFVAPLREKLMTGNQHRSWSKKTHFFRELGQSSRFATRPPKFYVVF